MYAEIRREQHFGLEVKELLDDSFKNIVGVKPTGVFYYVNRVIFKDKEGNKVFGRCQYFNNGKTYVDCIINGLCLKVYNIEDLSLAC